MIPFQLYGGQSPELHQLLQWGWEGGGEGEKIGMLYVNV